MDRTVLFAQHQDSLEDFWQRRSNRPRFERRFRIFGHPVRLLSNHEGVLAAVDHSLPLYTTAPDSDSPLGTVQLVVQAGRLDPGPVPETLMQRILYSGDNEWLMLHLAGWGHAHVDLGQRRATAVLTSQLAQRPDLVSQCLLDTVLLNFVLALGYAMLHASCLYRDGRALLLMAPHNSGKSTTALRLALAGYPLLSDSMIFITPHTERQRLLGFPVGRIKLRHDMAPTFPRLQTHLRAEAVRNETKYSLDLRQVDPTLVHETAATPTAVTLCLLSRHDKPESTFASITRAEVMSAVMNSSLYYDKAAVWQRNLAIIERLLVQAQGYHLMVGTAAEEILAAVGDLLEQKD